MTSIDPSLRATSTTCPYCGVGCGVLATPDGRGGAAISGDPSHPANLGRLCSKGSALGETVGLEDRLLYPMIRCSNGAMERNSLDTVEMHLRHFRRSLGDEFAVCRLRQDDLQTHLTRRFQQIVSLTPGQYLERQEL